MIMEEAMIMNLPEEILEEIFMKLELEEVEDLTTVCKKFNDVISSSVNLMESFHVFWNGKKLNDTRVILKSKRKFRNIFVKKISRIKSSLLKFITINACTLTYLSFYKCALFTSEFGDILKLVANNLKNLSLCDVNFVEDDDAQPIEFQKLDWIDLMYGGGQGYSVICNFFKGANSVKEFSYEDNCDLNSADVENYSQMLTSLEGLKRLSINHTLSQKLFLDNHFAECAKFKLEYLHTWIDPPEHISYPGATRQHYQFYMNFLNSQRHSLNELILIRFNISVDIVEHLLSLNLQKLTIYGSNFNIMRKIYVQNRSIEKLDLSTKSYFEASQLVLYDIQTETGICGIIENCFNLRSLKLAGLHISFEVSMSIVNHPGSLKKLKFYKCKVHPITYPKVESMSLNACTTQDEVVQVLRVNRQLKYVKLPLKIRQHEKFATALSELSSDIKLDFEMF